MKSENSDFVPPCCWHCVRRARAGDYRVGERRLFSIPPGPPCPARRFVRVNTATNLEVTTTTDTDGRYTFPSLPPGGPYSITVAAAGFNTEEHSGITLEVNQAARIDFTLQDRRDHGDGPSNRRGAADRRRPAPPWARSSPARTSSISRSISATRILWYSSRRACRATSASRTTT